MAIQKLKSTNNFGGFDYSIMNNEKELYVDVVKVFGRDCFKGKWVPEGYRVDFDGNTVYVGSYHECMKRAYKLIS